MQAECRYLRYKKAQAHLNTTYVPNPYFTGSRLTLVTRVEGRVCDVLVTKTFQKAFGKLQPNLRKGIERAMPKSVDIVPFVPDPAFPPSTHADGSPKQFYLLEDACASAWVERVRKRLEKKAKKAA